MANAKLTVEIDYLLDNGERWLPRTPAPRRWHWLPPWLRPRSEGTPWG